MKLLRTIGLLALAAVGACPQAQQTFTATLSATGATTPVLVNAQNHTLEVNVTGTASACAVQLEGSLDGSTWANLSGSQSCTSSPTMFHVDGKPIMWVRANLTAFTGATSATILYKGAL
jgi:hypothetical protein